jgi:hypothetical protein
MTPSFPVSCKSSADSKAATARTARTAAMLDHFAKKDG